MAIGEYGNGLFAAPLFAIHYSLLYHFSPNGLISISNVQALRGCW